MIDLQIGPGSAADDGVGRLFSVFGFSLDLRNRGDLIFRFGMGPVRSGHPFLCHRITSEIACPLPQGVCKAKNKKSACSKCRRFVFRKFAAARMPRRWPRPHSGNRPRGSWGCELCNRSRQWSGRKARPLRCPARWPVFPLHSGGDRGC